jgi:uncharacterized membrane protein
VETPAGPETAVLRVSRQPTALIAAGFLAVAIIFVASSDWYLAFKTVHVVFAVIWIGGGFLLTTLAFIAEQQGDPAGRAHVARQASMVGMKVFTPSALIVLAMGIAMMLNDVGKAAWDWGEFWVSFGLLGFLATFAIGIGLLTPAAKRIESLIGTVGPDAPEVHAQMTRIFLVARLDAAVLMLVVVDMTAKPFL